MPHEVEAVVAEQTAKAGVDGPQSKMGSCFWGGEATEALVDELLRTAVAATSEAPTRAVKLHGSTSFSAATAT